MTNGTSIAECHGRSGPKRMGFPYIFDVEGPVRGAIDVDQFEMLFHGCMVSSLGAGRALFQQGEQSNRIFGLVAGSVETSIYSMHGQKFVLDLQTGLSIIGEVGALDGGLRAMTARCRTDCVVACLGSAQLLERIHQNPILGHVLLQIVCARARWATEMLEDKIFLPVATRLARRLLVLDRLMADPSARWIRISQAEVADSLGAARESVNKLMRGWKTRAFIDVRRGFVRVLDRHGLHRLAVGEN